MKLYCVVFYCLLRLSTVVVVNGFVPWIQSSPTIQILRGGGGGGGGSEGDGGLISSRKYPIILFQSSSSIGETTSASRESDDNRSTTTTANTNTAATFPIPTNTKVVTKVAVAGATGRTGLLVVQELLKRNVQVVAMVRSLQTAADRFVNITTTNDNNDNDDHKLDVVQVDLTDKNAIQDAIQDCDAAIWCATGFSDSPSTSIIEKLKRLFNLAVTPKQQSIDIVGVPTMARILLNQKKTNQKARQSTPQMVLLSSAGVTRPSWDDTKKKKLVGCADIPIVRLNPFGILDIKAESEQQLRDSGVNYCIVRPGGLNDNNWPSKARLIVSQGDVAVGRIHRNDVANILCDVLFLPEACDKTFEVVSLAGYPPPLDIAPALKRLKSDSEGISEIEVEATYSIMQQLLPGEKQDAAALAMGQTYEQLDNGVTGRLGERGRENAEAAAPKPTNVV